MAVRTVIVEPETEKYLQNEADRLNRLDDVYRSLEWRLARNPSIGEQIPGWNPPRFLVKSINWKSIPFRLTLLYRFTDEEVVIEFARVEDV
jgi:hypothetical protein